MPSKPLTLSVAIITLNEERNIERCLKSLRFSWKVFKKLEVVVVDAEHHLLAVKGSVPGAKGGLVIVKMSVKA